MHVSTIPSFWDGMNEKFYTKYNLLDKQHHVWKDQVMAGKPIIGPLGREWAIPIHRDFRGDIKIPWTTLSNYPVQGTGADLMMLARLSAHTRIRRAGIPCDFISTVHDSIVLDTQEKYLQDLRVILEQVFVDLPKNIQKVFGYQWETPLAGECKYGPNMLDMRKFS